MTTETATDTVAPVIEHPFDLDLYMHSLLSAEPFFAEISRYVEKRATESMPTAGVRVTADGMFELAYNPKFFRGLTDAQRRGVLKHEFYHLVLGHVTERMPEGHMTKLWNIACDLAINSFIRNELPDIGCFAGEGTFADLPTHKASEWYYNTLSEKVKNKKSKSGDKGGEGGEGGEGGDPMDGFGDPMDDHSGWGENADKIDPSLRDLANERLRDMMRRAADEANKSSNGWGSVSSDLRKEIMDRISGKINWRSVLRYFIKTSQRASKTSTVKRINKRYAYIHPGQKVERHAKIAISIDQSGSVSDEMLAAFFAELNTLAKIATFTVVPFDTEVDEKLVYTWKKGMNRTKERVKHGGTDFNAPTRYVNSKNFDGHIILTDMQADKPIVSACQRMWMTTKECLASMPFKTHERVIPVE